MAKISMCRVCLGEDARLHSIVGTHLQEMYESLVLMPLETTDGRPVLVCYVCCARLKNCYEFRKSCLQSEELFTQMLSRNELTLQEIANKETLTMHNAIHLSIGHEPEKSADNLAVEALKCEVKEEKNDPEDSDEDALEENNVSDNIQSLIIVKEEHLSDLTVKKSNEASPRKPEDFTTSILKDHERVQNIFNKFIKNVATDKTATQRTNEVIFTPADDNTERPTSVPRSERVQYTCDTCQQCYSSKCELERHIRVCSDVWKTDLSRENSTSTHTAQDQHQCNKCNRQFSAKSSLSSHRCTYSGKKPFHCGICKKQFSLKDCVRIHNMRTHSGEKPHYCGICKKQLSVKTNLIRHVRTHTGEKPYHCCKCEKQFSDKTHLATHIRTHTGEKPYHCGICKQQFALRNSLNRHMRSHTGEKPFHCGICKKQFSDKTNLNRHIRIHTGEKPYHCGICKKQFSHRQSFNTHMRSHTGEKPFHCETCNKQFSRRSYLNTHMRTHTGEKPFHCRICKKQFPYRNSFNTHMRSHTGEKPFHCETCNKQFSQRSHLNRHMRTHTGEKPNYMGRDLR